LACILTSLCCDWKAGAEVIAFDWSLHGPKDCEDEGEVWELQQTVPGVGDVLPGILAAACEKDSHSEQKISFPLLHYYWHYCATTISMTSATDERKK
jgi:hypothetical protein